MGGSPAERTELRGLSSRKPGVRPDLPAVVPTQGFPCPIAERQPGPGSLTSLCQGPRRPRQSKRWELSVLVMNLTLESVRLGSNLSCTVD